MAGNVVRTAIALGWLVMTGLLVLRESSQEDGAQRIPLQTVLDLIFVGEQASILDLFQDGRIRGRVEIRPTADATGRQSAFNVQVRFPLPDGGRIEWTGGGDVKFTRDFEPVSGRFWAASDALQQRVSARFDTAADHWEFRVGGLETPLFEVSGSREELLDRVVELTTLVLGHETAQTFRRRLEASQNPSEGGAARTFTSGAAVYATRASLPYAAHQIDGSRIVMEPAPGFHAHLFVTSIGQILQVRTTTEFQLVAPVLQGVPGVEIAPLPDR